MVGVGKYTSRMFMYLGLQMSIMMKERGKHRRSASVVTPINCIFRSPSPEQFFSVKDLRPLVETLGLLLITIFKTKNLPSTSGDSLYTVTNYYIHIDIFILCVWSWRWSEWVKDLAEP